MGMSRKEVMRKLDQIVEFSGVESQLDMPVKFYSSGQYMRLGFAVAAHLDQEILILDEVLSVGDSAFRDKCREKIRELACSGRTVLLVSHSLSTVTELCQQVIWLDKGRLIASGDADEVVSNYKIQQQVS